LHIFLIPVLFRAPLPMFAVKFLGEANHEGGGVWIWKRYSI